MGLVIFSYVVWSWNGERAGLDQSCSGAKQAGKSEGGKEGKDGMQE